MHVIRPAVDSDLKPLSKALAPDVGYPQLANRFAEQRAGLRELLVLELEGVVVATVSISPGTDEDGETQRLFALDVGAEYRRRGYGSLLVSEVEKRVAEADQLAVRLEVEVDNHAALELYKKLGYEQICLPQSLTWSRGVDGHPSDTVTETCYRMRKVLSG